MKRQEETHLAKLNDAGFHKSSFSKTANCVEVSLHTSSYSNGKECVEAGACDCGKVMVRDTKDPKKTTLEFTRNEWLAFIKGVKNNEFEV